MNLDLNPLNWKWDSWKAAGRNVASYAAGGVTVAVAFSFISAGQGTDLSTGINDVVDGATQLAKGIGTIAGVLIPVYTAWRAAHSASPAQQMKAVVASSQNGMAPEQRKEMIKAVADMPEVKGVVATPEVAVAVPSDKVVATPRDVKV